MKDKTSKIVVVTVIFALAIMAITQMGLPQIVVRVNGQGSILDDVIPIYAEHNSAYWDAHCQNKYWWMPFDPVQLLYFETCADDGVTVQTARLQLIHWVAEPAGLNERVHYQSVWSAQIDAALIWR